MGNILTFADPNYGSTLYRDPRRIIKSPKTGTQRPGGATATNAGFGESTDAFPLPKGYSLNPDLQAHPHASSEIGIGSEDPMKGPQK